RFGRHDFVGLGVFEHTVLMDARFVGKRIGADDGLVYLHACAGDVLHQFAGADDVGGVDAALEREHVGAGFDRHDDFFQRRVAGTFADAVDGAFDLAGTVSDGDQRVGGGQSQIVLAVGGDDRLVDIGH